MPGDRLDEVSVVGEVPRIEGDPDVGFTDLGRQRRRLVQARYDRRLVGRDPDGTARGRPRARRRAPWLQFGRSGKVSLTTTARASLSSSSPAGPVAQTTAVGSNAGKPARRRGDRIGRAWPDRGLGRPGGWENRRDGRHRQGRAQAGLGEVGDKCCGRWPGQASAPRCAAAEPGLDAHREIIL